MSASIARNVCSVATSSPLMPISRLRMKIAASACTGRSIATAITPRIDKSIFCKYAFLSMVNVRVFIHIPDATANALILQRHHDCSVNGRFGYPDILDLDIHEIGPDSDSSLSKNGVRIRGFKDERWLSLAGTTHEKIYHNGAVRIIHGARCEL